MEKTSIQSIRTLLIGCGYAGRTFHAPLISHVQGLELALIATRNPVPAQAAWPDVAIESDYMKATQTPEIDLVVIATPNDSHHPLARAALLAGKAVVIDKPFTVTLAEAQDLCLLAQQRGLLLSVFHNRRWDGDFLTLASHIRSGRLGEVREFVSRFDRYDPVPRDRWRERAGPGAGLWHDLGPHLIDQTLCLFGLPDHVTADLACLRPGSEAIDYAQVTLGYTEPRRRVVLHCTRLAALPSARFEVHGEFGSLISDGLDVQEAQLKAGLSPVQPGWGQDPRPLRWLDRRAALQQLSPEASIQKIPRTAGDYLAYYRGIRDAMRGEAACPVPAREALVVMQVLECAIRSAHTGMTVKFDPS